MNKNDILYCKKIYKEAYNNTDKGDVDFIHEKDLDDIVVEFRLFLREVRGWEEYLEGKQTPYFKSKEPKIRIHQEHSSSYVFLISVREFDKIMEEYLSRKEIIKSN